MTPRSNNNAGRPGDRASISSAGSTLSTPPGSEDLSVLSAARRLSNERVKAERQGVIPRGLTPGEWGDHSNKGIKG